MSIEGIVKEMADGLSRELPKSLNSELVLNGVYASGNTIKYQLAFVNYIDGTASNDLVIRAVDNTKRAALTTMCTESMGQYLKMGAIVTYHYYDSRGSYLRNVTIQTTYNDCVQAGLALIMERRVHRLHFGEQSLRGYILLVGPTNRAKKDAYLIKVIHFFEFLEHAKIKVGLQIENAFTPIHNLYIYSIIR